jgi:hypothetical protein
MSTFTGYPSTVGTLIAFSVRWRLLASVGLSVNSITCTLRGRVRIFS